MSLHLVTGPAAEPLHIAEVRQHCKIDITDDDALLSIYLAAARQHAEQQTRRQIVAARWRMVLDRFPATSCESIRIPVGPVRRIVSIEYTDPDGVLQTLSATDYLSELSGEPIRIQPAYGLSWPSIRHQRGAVHITFDAGYAAHFEPDPATDSIRVIGWPDLAVGTVVRLSNSGGALPSPLKPRQNHYVAAVVSAGVYQLAETEGGPILPITAPGAGTHYLGQPAPGVGEGEIPEGLKSWILLRCDSLYSHRGETTSIRTGVLTPLPYIDRLLDPYRLIAV